MSNTGSLTKFYGSFFFGCAKVAISPYTTVFNAVAQSEDGQYRTPRIAAGASVCALFTLVVPILPVLTCMTITLAKLAAGLALLSMIAAYPIAIVRDAIEQPNYSYA